MPRNSSLTQSTDNLSLRILSTLASSQIARIRSLNLYGLAAHGAFVDNFCIAEAMPLSSALCGTIPPRCGEQRPTKRADLWALHVALCHLEEHAVALRNGEMNCVCDKHNGADRWVLTWQQLHAIEERSWCATVKWVKAHTMKKAKKQDNESSQIRHRRQ